MKRVAILIAASPTRAFFSQLAVLRLAIGRLRWSRWRPSLHVYVGGPQEPDALAEWARYLDDVEIRWTSAARYAADGDWAQSDDVFVSPPADADVLLAMDADTLPVDALELVLDRVAEDRAVAGVIAHYPPLPRRPLDETTPVGPAGRIGLPPPSIRSWWSEYAQDLTAAPAEFPFSHTLMLPSTPVEHREAPFYLNFGVVFFAREAFDDIAPTYLALRPAVVDRLSSPDFSGQVALTLAAAAKRIPTWALPMRYNFPNDPIAEQMYPTELDHVTVYHYLRTNLFDRHRIFISSADYDEFLALPLQGVNQRFQRAVREIVGESYPFV